MAWKIEFDPAASKDLKKMDKKVQKDILDYLEKRIATAHDPRRFGKPLQHNKAGLWRYRVEDVRIICQIEDQNLVVLVVEIGHRREIYKK